MAIIDLNILPNEAINQKNDTTKHVAWARGDSTARTFKIIDDAGAAVDVSGYTEIKMTVNSLFDPADNSTQQFEIIGDKTAGASGLVKFTPTITQTNILADTYFYDIQAEDGSNVISTLIKSKVHIIQDISKTASGVTTPDAGVITLLIGDSIDNGATRSIKVGAGGDLKIYHQGDSSFITESGSGHLKIQGQNVYLKNDDGKDLFVTGAGSVMLHHVSGGTSTMKAQTTNTGLTLFGNLIVDDGTYKTTIVENASSDITLTLPSSTGTLATVADVQAKDTLAEMNDVNITSPTDGSVLKYDNASSKWIDSDKLTETASGINVTGNISVTGTVDNVDVAALSSSVSNVDNTSDANKPVSTATQSALNLKANIASPTFTGTVGGITSAMVGLPNVDNTTDADKPVSTATQSALNLKAPIASPTFTGTVSADGLNVVTPDGTSATINVGADYLHVVCDDLESGLIVRSDSTDAGSTPDLYLRRTGNAATGLANLGVILFQGLNNASPRQNTTYANIVCQQVTTTDNDEDGKVLHRLLKDGTITTILEVEKTGINVNGTVTADSFRLNNADSEFNIFTDASDVTWLVKNGTGTLKLKSYKPDGAASTADDGIHIRTDDLKLKNNSGGDIAQFSYDSAANTNSVNIDGTVTADLITASLTHNIQTGNETMSGHVGEKTINTATTGSPVYTFPDVISGDKGKTWLVVNAGSVDISCTTSGGSAFYKLISGVAPVSSATVTVAKGGVAEFLVTDADKIFVFGSGLA